MHIGNEANFEQNSSYLDGEGNVRNYTVTDYSRKTKVATVYEKIDYETYFKEYRESLVERLLSVQACNAPIVYERYTIMSPYGEREWDGVAIKDEGIPLYELMSMTAHCERAQEVAEGK